MADWKTHIKIGDLHAAHEAGTMTVQQVGLELAKRLKTSPYAEELDYEIELLECVDDVDDYDDVLRDLYDFGDYDHRIWFDPT